MKKHAASLLRWIIASPLLLASLPAQVDEPMASAITFADTQMRAMLADLGFGASGTNPDWVSTEPPVPKVTTNDSGNVDWGYQSRTGNWGAGFTPGMMWDLYELTGDAYWLEKADAFTDGMEPNKTAGGDMRMNIGFHFMNSYARRIQHGAASGDEPVMETAADTLLLSWMENVGSLWSFSWGRGFRYDGLMGGWSAYQNTIIDSAPNIEILFHQAKKETDVDMWNKSVSHFNNLMRDNIRPDGSTVQLSAYDASTGDYLGPRAHQGYSPASTWSRGQGWAMHGFASAWRETRDTAMAAAFHDLYSYYRDNCPPDGVPYWDFIAPELTVEQLEFRYADNGVPNPGAITNQYDRDTSAAALAASALLLASRLAEDESLAMEYYEYGLHILTTLSTPGFLACDGSYSPTKESILGQGSYTFPGTEKGQIWGDFFYVEALRRYRDLVDPASSFEPDPDWGDLQSYRVDAPARWTVTGDLGDPALRLQGRETVASTLPADVALYRFASFSDFSIGFSFRPDELLAAGNPVDVVFVFGYENPDNYCFVRISDTPGRSGIHAVSSGVLSTVAFLPDTWSGQGYHDVAIARTGQTVEITVDAVSWGPVTDAALSAAGFTGFGGMGNSLYFDEPASSIAGTAADAAPRYAWKAVHFTHPLGIQARDGLDPDLDGRVTLLEYAFGSDPMLADRDQPGLGIAMTGGTSLEVSFPWNGAYRDITYSLMRTTDGGATWQPVRVIAPDGSGGWATGIHGEGTSAGPAALYRMEIGTAGP